MTRFQLFIICTFFFNIQVTTSQTGVWYQHKNGVDDVTEYMVSTSQKNYFKAIDRCKEEKGRLAILSTDEAFMFITNQSEVVQGATANLSYYIGAMNVNGIFKWDGDTTRFGKRWGPGQPNRNHNCVVLRYEPTRPVYRWYTAPCHSGNFSFICQRKPGSYWSDWGSWSNCSNSCNRGNRTRERVCQATRTTGPQICETQSRMEMNETCNENICTSVTLNETSCSAACGESGYLEKFLICENGEALPQNCSNRRRVKCSGSCSTSMQTRSEQTSPLPSTRAIPSSVVTMETKASITPINERFPLGAIAGGAAGGIVFLLFLIFIFIFLRKRTSKTKAYEGEVPAETDRDHTNGNQQKNEEEISPSLGLSLNDSFDGNPNASGVEGEYDSLQHHQEANGVQASLANRPDSYSIVRKPGTKGGVTTDYVYNVLNTDATKPEDNYIAMASTKQASPNPVPSTSSDYDHMISNQVSNFQKEDVIAFDVNSGYNSLSFNKLPDKDVNKALYEVVDEKIPPKDETTSPDHSYEQVNPSSQATVSNNDYDVFMTS